MQYLKFFLIILLSVISAKAEFLETQSAQARKEKKLILVTIESPTCVYCAKMKKEIFNAPLRKEIDKKFIVVTFQNDDPRLPPDLVPQYVPANAILSPVNQDVIDAYVGYIEPKRFMEILNNAYASSYK